MSFDRLPDELWLDQCKEICSICKKEIVQYFCDEPTCPKKDSDTFYCQECMENGIHEHFSIVEIQDVMEEMVTEVNTLHQQQADLERTLVDRLGRSRDLVEFLNRAMYTNCNKVSKFEQIQTQGQELIRVQERLKIIIRDIKLKDLKPFQEDFRKYKETSSSLAKVEWSKLSVDQSLLSTHFGPLLDFINQQISANGHLFNAFRSIDQVAYDQLQEWDKDVLLKCLKMDTSSKGHMQTPSI